MAVELWTNNAATVLASAISNSQTTISVAAGKGALFPSPTGGDWFWATIDDGVSIEVVKCTGRSTDDLTVVRAQQGTSGTAFASGAKIELRPTKSTLEGFEQTARKNVADGYCGLDGSGKVAIAQLPATVVGSVEYQGTWNANTNSPDLPGSSPSKGDYYVVSADGSTSLGGITDWKIGDWAIYNGSAWEKVDNSDAAAALIAIHEAASDPHTGYQKESEKNAANGYAGLGADAYVNPAVLPPVLQHFGTQVAPGAVAGWQSRGSTLDTAADLTNGGFFILRNAAAGVAVAMKTKNPTMTGAFTAEFLVIPHFFNVATARMGVCLYESGTGKIITLGWERPGGFTVFKYNSNTSESAAYTFESIGAASYHYLRIKRDGSNNYVFGVSWNGVHYYDIVTSPIANFFTTAADEIGVFCVANNASRPCGLTLLSYKFS